MIVDDSIFGDWSEKILNHKYKPFLMFDQELHCYESIYGDLVFNVEHYLNTRGK
jgi:hypothetical protein